MNDTTQIDLIQPLIHTVRGQKVILDNDLARLYGVPTKRLNEQIRRNRKRFPEDFMFRLTADEDVDLRSQNATSSSGHGGRRYLPLAFTEHGAIMAANVLSSAKAIDVSVYVIRAFVRLRDLLGAHKELTRKVSELDQKLCSHDVAIRQLIDAIKQLMAPPPETKRRGKIGFGRPIEE